MRKEPDQLISSENLKDTETFYFRYILWRMKEMTGAKYSWDSLIKNFELIALHLITDFLHEGEDWCLVVLLMPSEGFLRQPRKKSYLFFSGCFPFLLSATETLRMVKSLVSRRRFVNVIRLTGQLLRTRLMSCSRTPLNWETTPNIAWVWLKLRCRPLWWTFHACGSHLALTR